MSSKQRTPIERNGKQLGEFKMKDFVTEACGTTSFPKFVQI